tara:strand:- start:123022 stop:124365 length:1344 start_codon:yes stop_codon:yes gene_type:complete
MAANSNRRLAGRGAISIAIRFLSAGLGFALVFAMARWMPTDEFGHFGYAFSLATALSVMLDFGQCRLILRSLSTYSERGRTDLMSAVLRFSLMVSVVGILASVLVILLWSSLSHAHPSIIPAAALTAGMILADFQANLLRGLGNLVRSLVPKEIVWRPLAISLMALAGGGLTIVTDATTALWFLAITLLVLNALQLLFIVRPRWRRALAQIAAAERVDPTPDETLDAAKSMWRKSSVRLWLATAMNAAITPLSVVVVGQFISPAETGAFFAAVRVATIIAFPLQGLNLLTAPMLARNYAANNLAQLQRVASFTAIASTAMALLGAVILGFFGAQLLDLLNPSFSTSATALLVIMAGFVIAAICGSSGQLMNMTGHDREFLKILATFNIVGFAALLLLTREFGAIGAAWGLLVVKAGWNIAVVIWARRNLGIDPSILGPIFVPKAVVK